MPALACCAKIGTGCRRYPSKRWLRIMRCRLRLEDFEVSDATSSNNEVAAVPEFNSMKRYEASLMLSHEVS